MVDPTPNTIENKMLYVSFNQDASCFAVSTDKGFQIFSSNPFKETYRRSNFKKIILIRPRRWNWPNPNAEQVKHSCSSRGRSQP